MELANQAALVTGGGSGLGAATARMLAGQGVRVTCLDVNMDAARAVADDIGGLALACDITDAAATEAAIAQAREAHGPARITVSCAGIAPAKKILGRNGVMPLDDFRRGVEINLIGSFNVLRLAAADMAELDPTDTGERGVIINTASIAGYEGQIGQTSYAASKAGVIGLTLPAAREFAPLGIRVCAIAPGIFETAMLKGLPQAAQDSLGASVPFPSRLGHPNEYAALVQSILANPMINGEVIRIDGALRMPPK